MNIYLFEDMNLSPGFVFPQGLIDVLNSDPVLYPEPWFFTYEYPDLARENLMYVKMNYSNQNYIPFASDGNSDDFACFDGNDHSGNPRVHIVHFFASPGWEDRGSFENFEAWLEFAKNESEEYKRLMNEDVSNDI